MTLRAALALALTIEVVSGCGGSRTIGSVAVSLPWPHGTTVSVTRVPVPGRLLFVTVGSLRLRRGQWSCIGPSSAARYEIAEAGAAVTISDAASTCARSRALVPMVGGYANGGGYVGEWSPAAAVYER